jgi:ribosomal subunit interface protein
MDITFTGRGLEVTDAVRGMAEQKLSSLARLEPRATALDLELINEHHPRLDGVKRVEASLRIPRKIFRAHAEADDVPPAIDRVRHKLERQVRDHHGRKKPVHGKGALGYAPAADADAGAAADVGDADV